MKEDKEYTLNEAVGNYLDSLSPEEKRLQRGAILRFVQWYGRERLLSALEPPDTAGYARQFSSTDTEAEQKLEPLKKFFSFAVKKGWLKSGLGAHLKFKKKKKANLSGRTVEVTEVTRQGLTKLKDELAEVKKKRLEVVAEISRAAADKDFRENAPLEAAREQCSHIDGRIKELEAAIKTAVIIEEKRGDALKVTMGDTLVLRELGKNEELVYTIVSPREVDPVKGKISSASPIGKALIDKREGETITIEAPMGKTEYRIEKINKP